MIRAYENIQKLLRVKLYNNCKIFEKYLILSFVYFLETSISHNYSPSSLTSFLFYFSLLLTSRLFPRQLEREVHFTYIRTHTHRSDEMFRGREILLKNFEAKSPSLPPLTVALSPLVHEYRVLSCRPLSRRPFLGSALRRHYWQHRVK